MTSIPGRPTAGAATSYLNDLSANTVRWAWRLRREPTTILVECLQPVLWLLLFGHLFASEAPKLGVPGTYLAFMTAGVVVMTVFNVTLAGGLEMMFDRESGMLRRLMVTPVHRSTLLAGRFVFAVLVGTGQAVLVLVAARVMGVALGGTWLSLLLVLAAGMLLGAGVGIVSLVLAMRLKNHGPFYTVIGFVSLPVTFVSTAFAPLSSMAPWLAAMARLNPLTYAIDAVRSLLLLHTAPVTVLPLLGYLVVFDLICLAVGVYVFRQALA